jgi:hypothetical protein
MLFQNYELKWLHDQKKIQRTSINLYVAEQRSYLYLKIMNYFVV